MKFCIECGKELNKDQVFCIECGAEQPNKNTAQKTENIQQRTEKVAVQKKPLSKKSKWLIGIAAGLLVLLIGAHLILSNYFNPVNALKEMDTAIVENDSETFLGHINFDSEAQLDGEAYFQYIKENEWNTVKSQYIQLIESENDVFLHETIYASNGESLFTVKENTLLFNLYPTYELQAIPTKLIFTSNMENTEVTLGEVTNTIEGTEATHFLDLYAGNYQLLASATNLFGLFEKELDLTVNPAKEMEVEIYFEGDTYTFYTNKEDAFLFINGENTEKQFSELEYLGPIPFDSKENYEMHGEWNNDNDELIKTETLKFDDNSWYGFEFYFEEQTVEEEEETKDSETAGDVVLDFRDAYQDSLNERNFDLIAPFLKNNSNVYDELRIYIGDLEDTAFHYEFIQNEILDIAEIDDSTVEVTTNELFTFTNHLDDTIDYDRTKIYTLELVDDSYQITNISYQETNRDYN